MFIIFVITYNTLYFNIVIATVIAIYQTNIIVIAQPTQQGFNKWAAHAFSVTSTKTLQKAHRMNLHSFAKRH